MRILLIVAVLFSVQKAFAYDNDPIQDTMRWMEQQEKHRQMEQMMDRVLDKQHYKDETDRAWEEYYRDYGLEEYVN